MVDRGLTYFMFVNHKHEKVPRHHPWSTDQPSLLIIFLSLSSCTIAKKSKRGFKFTIAELEHLLDDVINRLSLVIPIGRRSGMSIWLLISQWSRHQDCSRVSFMNLFTNKFLLVTPTVLLMFTRPSKFQGKLLLLTMGPQAVQGKMLLNNNKLFWTSKLQTCLSFLSTKVEQRSEPWAGDTPSAPSWIRKSGCWGRTDAITTVCGISAISYSPLHPPGLIVLRLCMRPAALAVPGPHHMLRPTWTVWCGTYSRVYFWDPFQFIFGRTRGKGSKVRE